MTLASVNASSILLPSLLSAVLCSADPDNVYSRRASDHSCLVAKCCTRCQKAPQVCLASLTSSLEEGNALFVLGDNLLSVRSMDRMHLVEQLKQTSVRYRHQLCGCQYRDTSREMEGRSRTAVLLLVEWPFTGPWPKSC